MQPEQPRDDIHGQSMFERNCKRMSREARDAMSEKKPQEPPSTLWAHGSGQ